MLDEAFCPHCGAPRPEWARFCGKCGNGYDAAPAGQAARSMATPAPAAPPSLPAPVPPPADPAVENPRQIATLAGVAWIAGALLMGYIALLQLGYASEDQSYGEAALWNGVTAAISVAAGALLLSSPSPSRLAGSAVFGLLSAAYQAWQISQGATHEAFLGATVAYGAAGVLSAVAWSRWQPEGPRPGMILCASCGKPVDDSPALGCPFCGKPIRSTASPAT